eukprot:TRINITY_DN3410_c0_g1_i3.p1 TRINITY_DN3410_c0_g1~~TRINITY_DN3410_c0_g1_i3.p1  ORF type:complete len:588 (+),score=129.95 TRINITY_DN3410_c0_g1_i3:51-1814(+)
MSRTFLVTGVGMVSIIIIASFLTDKSRIQVLSGTEKGICPKGSKVPGRFVSLGTDDDEFNAQQGLSVAELTLHARWATITLPEATLSVADNLLYSDSLKAIKLYKSLLHPSAHVTLKAPDMSTAVRALTIRTAAACSGTGYVPSSVKPAMLLNSICHYGNHSFWIPENCDKPPVVQRSEGEGVEQAPQPTFAKLIHDTVPPSLPAEPAKVEEAALPPPAKVEEATPPARVEEAAPPARVKEATLPARAEEATPPAKVEEVVVRVEEVAVRAEESAAEKEAAPPRVEAAAPPPRVVVEDSAPPREKQKCRSLSEVYQAGRLNGGHWEPERCTMQRYTTEGVLRCLKSNPFLGVGDSLAQRYADLFRREFYKAGSSSGPTDSRFLWSPTTLHQFTLETQEDSKTVSLESFVQTDVKTVLLSFGIWEMGVNFCGTDAFYNGLKNKVEKFLSVSGNGTKVLLLDIPYIHRGKAAWVDNCNPLTKVKVFRKMIHQVASCLRIGVFDMFDVQKQATSNTVDGVHITGDAMWAAGEVLLNVMCDGVDPYYPSLPCTPGAVGANLNLWKQDPIAGKRSSSCVVSNQPEKRDCPSG